MNLCVTSIFFVRALTLRTIEPGQWLSHNFINSLSSLVKSPILDCYRTRWAQCGTFHFILLHVFFFFLWLSSWRQVVIRAGAAWASGVVVSADGYIITSAHLLLPLLPPSAETRDRAKEHVHDISTSSPQRHLESPVGTGDNSSLQSPLRFQHNQRVFVRVEPHNYKGHLVSSTTSPSSSSPLLSTSFEFATSPVSALSGIYATTLPAIWAFTNTLAKITK